MVSKDASLVKGLRFDAFLNWVSDGFGNLEGTTKQIEAGEQDNDDRTYYRSSGRVQCAGFILVTERNIQTSKRERNW